MEHAGRVTRTSSSRTFARPAHGPHGTRRKGDPNVEPPNVRSLVALMEHDGRVTRTSSPRAFVRLAYDPHGARRKGDPIVEPPSVRSARLRPSWSTPKG